MRAGEHQGQALVGDTGLGLLALGQLGQQRQVFGGAAARTPVPCLVNQGSSQKTEKIVR